MCLFFILGTRLKKQLLSGTHKGKRATELVEPHNDLKLLLGPCKCFIRSHSIAEASHVSKPNGATGKDIPSMGRLCTSVAADGMFDSPTGGASDW